MWQEAFATTISRNDVDSSGKDIAREKEKNARSESASLAQLEHNYPLCYHMTMNMYVCKS